MSRVPILWKAFQKGHATLNEDEQWAKWKAFPHRKKKAHARVYAGEAMTYKECIARYKDHNEMSEIYEWFRLLPRQHDTSGTCV